MFAVTVSSVVRSGSVLYLTTAKYSKTFEIIIIELLGDEMEDKAALEEQMRAVMDKYKYKKRQIRELQEDLQAMSFTLDNLTRDENVYVEMIDEKQVRLIPYSNFHFEYIFV